RVGLAHRLGPTRGALFNARAMVSTLAGEVAMLRLIILALGALAIAFIVMVKFLPWWASVLAVLVLMLVTPKLLKYALYRAFKYPFVLKGRALAGATARVHAVC